MKNNHKTIYRNSLFLVFYLSTVPSHATTLNPFIFHVNTVAVGIKQSEVHGTIKDSQGMSLAGVSISVKGTQKGTVSDFNGFYTIKVDVNEVLVFSFIGFKTQEITVSGSELDVILETDITALNTVEINAGYYTVSDRERTGNISRITSKTIDKQPVNNPLAAMQGHMSGVNIVQSTGVPGGGFSIEIRGKNFINGATEPLYIVDGVPFGGQSLEATSIGSSINQGNVSPLNAINPSDIESIEVLKDADATAIYGSRGANGVVLITTKKGKVGKTRFQASLTTTLGQVSNYLDLMNTQQYLEVRREAIINDNFGTFLENPAYDFVWPDLKTWDQNRYTDWQKELIGGTAFRNNAQLSVSGGSERTQFLISGGSQKETTVFPGDSNYKKSSLHSNITHQSEDQRFKINLSTNFSVEDNKLPLADFTLLAKTLAPNAPALYDTNGRLNWENNTWDNPLASLERTYKAKSNSLIGNMGLSYLLGKGLEFKTSLGYTNYQLDTYTTFPSTAFRPSLGYGPERSSLTRNASTRQSWIIEPQLNWKHQWGQTNLDILVGSTFQQDVTEQSVIRGTGFPSNNLIRNLAAANEVEVLQEMDSEYRYQAFFGRINLTHRHKYILNLTGRRDGSSRFGPGKQFGNFGAVGVAWLFSEESFLKESSFLSFGKLRGSYGVTGSDNIGDYRFLDTYNVTGFDYDGTTVFEPSGIFNPLFGWESNNKLEAALELGFFKDRVSLSGSWYQNRSSSQLIGIPLAATTGFTEVTGNFNATVENTGFEIDLQSVNIQTKQFTWSTTFNFTVAKNRLVSFPGLETSTFANRYIIGKPLRITKLYHALGVDPETGIYQFEDYSGNGTIGGVVDRQWIVDLTPEYFGGFGNSFTYKNLTLECFFQFKKQKGYTNVYYGASVGFMENKPVSFLDRWQEPGDIKPIQRANFGRFPGVGVAAQNQAQSSAAIGDASFIRLRNIMLNYKLPKTATKGMDINLFLQGQNLWTLTDFEGLDPEQPLNGYLPPLRQVTLGLQLGF
ncbi:MAG: SusC/RagA family protein [Flavobacteriales bacterium 32-35-8]|nr:MAG: SusC/RagA family protein [Flavobacteriales bacterium 32-35-8]